MPLLYGLKASRHKKGAGANKDGQQIVIMCIEPQRLA